MNIEQTGSIPLKQTAIKKVSKSCIKSKEKKHSKTPIMFTIKLRFVKNKEKHTKLAFVVQNRHKREDKSFNKNAKHQFAAVNKLRTSQA